MGLADVAGSKAGANVEHAQWLEAIAREREALDVEVIRQSLHIAARLLEAPALNTESSHLARPLALAQMLYDLHLDCEAIAAAILHDTLRRTGLAFDRVEGDSSPGVMRLLRAVERLDGVARYEDMAPKVRHGAHAFAGIRTLLVALIEDVRVVLIKLAERLEDMRRITSFTVAERRQLAWESLEIYAPLASRLGIGQLKWELEDLAFAQLYSESYRAITTQLDESRRERERFVADVALRLSDELRHHGIEARISGRPKHIYSIWRKMREKTLSLSQVFDIRGLRVLVASTGECYTALGVVHGLWQAIPSELDDYIAKPKGNEYRSLHTAVIGPEGKTIEVQIRTHDMHQQAELGVAAHWRYKEGPGRDAGVDVKVRRLRQLVEWLKEPTESGGLLDRFSAEVMQDRVYVLSPRGKVVDLPRSATPLDFAYHVHTEIGHQCRGAKVNGKLVPLRYQLKTGERVEILVGRRRGPSRDWLTPQLGYLKTARARAKVRHWFKQQDHRKDMAAGREIFERERRRLGMAEVNLPALLKRLNFVAIDGLHASLGRGDVSAAQLSGALRGTTAGDARELPVVNRPASTPAAGAVRVQGVGDLLTQVAKCCKPVPNEPIVGYITRGRGITVHRRDCSNVRRLADAEGDRLVEVLWGATSQTAYPVDIQLRAHHADGLLGDITSAVSNENVRVVDIRAHLNVARQLSSVRLTLQVADLAQLDRLVERLATLSGVLQVRRCR